MPLWLISIAMLLCSLLTAQAQTLNMTHERVLIVNQLADNRWRSVGEGRASTIERLILHFTPHVTTIDSSTYRSGTLKEFTMIFVIGNEFEAAFPKPLLDDLVGSAIPTVWIGYNVEQLLSHPGAGYEFVAGQIREKPGDRISVVYQEQTWPTNLSSYTKVHIQTPGARIWSSLQVSDDLIRIPYIVTSKNLWYVNSLLDVDDDYPNPLTDAPILIFSDVLHELFETKIVRAQRAIIRLEDVSTHVNSVKLKSVVDYLRKERVPYAVGLIPNQRQKDGAISPLRNYPDLVNVLLSAQQNGGTIALHGYHHTFGTGEDYEFWDADRNQPLANETRQLYACKVEDGIRLLRELGLEPRLWETPHYAASPLAYKTFGEFFSHAIENRGWGPYPYGPDRFGQIVIPENLGYIHPESGWTVDKQLARARMLRIVRDSWSVGFYHPVTIPLKELDALVIGLRSQGLSFVDLRAFPMQITSDSGQSVLAEGPRPWNWHILKRPMQWLNAKWSAIAGTVRRGSAAETGPCDQPGLTVNAAPEPSR